MSCPSYGNKWSAIAQRFVAANVLRLPNKWPMSDFTPRMIKKKGKESGAADQFLENWLESFWSNTCVCPHAPDTTCPETVAYNWGWSWTCPWGMGVLVIYVQGSSRKTCWGDQKVFCCWNLLSDCLVCLESRGVHLGAHFANDTASRKVTQGVKDNLP